MAFPYLGSEYIRVFVNGVETSDYQIIGSTLIFNKPPTSKKPGMLAFLQRTIGSLTKNYTLYQKGQEDCTIDAIYDLR